MNHALSTHLFVNHRLTVALLSRIEQAGIPAVEIFCARQHLDYRDKAQVAELGTGFETPRSSCTRCIRPCTPTKSGAAPARTR
jgi:hypothetical protein